MSGISSIGSSTMSSIYSQMVKRPDPAEMFKKVDTDGDGGISQTELETMAEKMANRTGNTLNASEAITTYDTDGDALLSQDEMGTMLMALKDILGPPPATNSGTSPEEAAAAYQANSGETEETTATRPGPPPSPEEMFNSLDTNGDGVISQEELEALFDEMTALTGQSQDSAEAIKTYDSDGDGSLSQEEMDAMMTGKRDSIGPPPSRETPASAEQAVAAYLANSEDSDSVATLLDLLDRYVKNINTDSLENPLTEI